MCIKEHTDGPELCHSKAYTASGSVGVVSGENRSVLEPFKLVFLGSWTICEHRMISGGRVTRYLDWIKQVTGIDYSARSNLVFKR